MYSDPPEHVVGDASILLSTADVRHVNCFLIGGCSNPCKVKSSTIFTDLDLFPRIMSGYS